MIANFYRRFSCQKQVLQQTSIGLLVVFVYISPYLILGTNTPVLIFDNLDQAPIQFWQIYHNSNPFWHASVASPMVMNGALPAFGGPNLKWDNLPYYFFPPFTAYVTLQILTRMIAFFGVWLLLRSLFHKGEKHANYNLICTGIAILYSILPLNSPTAFTVPTLPFLAWALFKIAVCDDRWWHWATLCLIPFFTSLFLAPVFLIFIAGALWLLEAIIRRRVNWRWFGALAFVSLLYCVSEYDQVLGVFGNSFVSHRVEFQTTGMPFKDALFRAMYNFCFGQHHVATYHLILIPLFGLTVGLALTEWGHQFKHRYYKDRSSDIKGVPARCDIALNGYLGPAVGAFIVAGAFSLFYGLYQWSPIVSLRQAVPIIKMVQWDRVHWLHPLVWYVGLASLLFALGRMLQPRYGQVCIICILIFQGVILFGHADYIKSALTKAPTWKQFFATEQFDAIRFFIGEPVEKYRVVSLGIHPSISLYNGFYCLDGYCANYSLNYKKIFRRVIGKELAKSETIQSYFDNWGSRCYLFSSELGSNLLHTKKNSRSIVGLDLDLGAFAQLGGKYIFSAVEISNPEKSGLKLLKVFDHPQSAWRIWLYAPLTNVGTDKFGA